MSAGKLIAVKLYDNFTEPVDADEIKSLSKTNGRGMSFVINGQRHYTITDGSYLNDPTGWLVLGGDEFRRLYTDVVESDTVELIPVGIRRDRLYVILTPSDDEERQFQLSNGNKFTSSIIRLYDILSKAILADTDVEGNLRSLLTDAGIIKIFFDPNNKSILDIDDSEQKKENNIMNFNLSNTLLKNLRCGKAGPGFGISLFDGSITYKGHSFNGTSLVETAGFELDAADFLFIMPANSIKKGDIVAIGNDAAYYDGESFISLSTGMKTEYVPITCFGMTFYSVVRNMLGNITQGNGNGNSMASLLPLMLLDKNGDSDNIMMLMLLMNGGLNFNFANPTATAPVEPSK